MWADLEGGGASNLTGANRGRMWIGAVSPASVFTSVATVIQREREALTNMAAG